MDLKKIRCCFLFVFSLCNIAPAQTQLTDKQFETYDLLVGAENTNLYNGTEFTDLFLNTDGTYRYFKGFDYTPGTIVYNGQYYVDVLLKYNVLEDNLLARSDDNLSVFNIQLLPEFVESFTVRGHHFVKIPKTDLPFSGNGYFEVAYLGDALGLYVKRNKKKREKPLKTGIQYSFAESDSYILKQGSGYNLLGGGRDLRKLFPGKEDEIRKFYKSHKSLEKSNPDKFYINLIQYLDGQISQRK